MIRRILAVLLSVTSLCLTASCENKKTVGSSPIARIGILLPDSGRGETQSVKGLREGLKDLGYKEGENLLVEMRDAKGDRAVLEALANELVSKEVRLIFTTGTRATQVAKAATSKIPIVFRHPADPVTLGLVKSVTRPGANVTGVAAFALEMTEKRLEVLKRVLPRVSRVHIFYDANDRFSRENFVVARKSAEKLGLQVVEHGVKSTEELKKSLDNLPKDEGGALFQIPDDLVESEADFIFATARQKRLPTIFNEEGWAIKGALGAYGPNYYQMGRQAAQLAQKILQGSNPGDLPIERASKFDLVLNLRTANAIALDLPPDVLKNADRIIR